MESGQILEKGTHRDLMRLNGRYAAMYALRFAVGNANRALSSRSTWEGIKKSVMNKKLKVTTNN